METKKRVHIMPLGFENDRIVSPAKRESADKVILLDYIADDIERPAYHAEVKEELKNSGVKLEIESCNLFDLYESIATIAAIAVDETEAGNIVYVNLATGSTITGIAGMIACMVTHQTYPYYVQGDEYNAGTEEPIVETAKAPEKLPQYPMDHPEKQHIEVLGFLKRQRNKETEGNAKNTKVYKKDIISYGKENGLEFVSEYSGDTEKGYYRRLERHVLEPLEQKGYVEIKEQGRKKLSEITETGENTHRAFSYLIE